MSTRAVHLEVAEDYSSEAFLSAFHRFTARRGHCAELFSDCGTNFVGADKQLREMFTEASVQYQQITYSLSHESTTWTFNPPSAPHFGGLWGLWEAAVKSAKRHLRRVIGEQILTFVEYSTLLCRIEACLNSRPLTPLSDDASELCPLTPAHFLIQRCSFLVPEPEASTSKVSLSKRWELVTQLSQHFWRRWLSEYLSTLQLRLKWQVPTRPLQKGDMVLIKSEITPLGKWPLGRIVDLHPGADGLVRVATVQTPSSIVKRPIVKLVVLHSPQVWSYPFFTLCCRLWHCSSFGRKWAGCSMFRYLKISKGSRGYQDASSRLEQPISRRIATSPQSRGFRRCLAFRLATRFSTVQLGERDRTHRSASALTHTHYLRTLQIVPQYNLFSVFFHRHPHLILNKDIEFTFEA